MTELIVSVSQNTIYHCCKMTIVGELLLVRLRKTLWFRQCLICKSKHRLGTVPVSRGNENVREQGTNLQCLEHTGQQLGASSSQNYNCHYKVSIIYWHLLIRAFTIITQNQQGELYSYSWFKLLVTLSPSFSLHLNNCPFPSPSTRHPSDSGWLQWGEMKLGSKHQQTMTISSRLRNQSMLFLSVCSITSEPFQYCGQLCRLTPLFMGLIISDHMPKYLNINKH